MLFQSCTTYLSASILLEEVAAIAVLLESVGVEEVVVFKGWGWIAPIDALWKPICIPLQSVVDFVASNVQSGEFVPCGSDLIIESSGDAWFRVLFCHESDIHLETDSDSFFRLAQERWGSNGLLRSVHATRGVTGAKGRVPYKAHVDHGFCLADIKQWREREEEAGRPSSLRDFYEARGLCSDCLATGVRMEGWRTPDSDEEIESARAANLEEIPFYGVCPTCAGTGVSGNSAR